MVILRVTTERKGVQKAGKEKRKRTDGENKKQMLRQRIKLKYMRNYIKCNCSKYSNKDFQNG